MSNELDPLEEAVHRYMLKHKTLDELEILRGIGDVVRKIGTPRDMLKAEGWRMSEDNEPGALPQPDMSKPQRVKTLEIAINLTAGDRDKAYGPPYHNLSDCALLWDAYLAIRNDKPLDAEAVAWLNVLQKVARSCQPGYHPDNYTDAAAYSAIAGECREQEEANKWT